MADTPSIDDSSGIGIATEDTTPQNITNGSLPTIEEIREGTEKIFGKTPCLFQVELCLAQLQSQAGKSDIVSIAATGSGKTLCFLMPLLFNKDKIIVIITALNLLGEQFVAIAEKAGFKAISVTADNATKQVFETIKRLQYRVVIFNPEIIAKRRGFCETVLWPSKVFVSKISEFIFDEGHCVTQWGSTFRPEYGEVGILRYLVPDVPFYLTSATIPPAMIPHLKETLHITNCQVFRRSNDRHNISLCVRKMKYAMSSYEDLAFLIPLGWKEGHPPPKKFMIFFNSKREAEDACLFLRRRVSQELRARIKWFHAGMTSFFRSEEMKEYKEGNIWGFGMTDVGGMGIDIPDVEVIVQWKVPTDLNTLVQRFGRAVRDFSMQGVAILIAEARWFYEDHVRKEECKLKRKRKANDQLPASKRRRINAQQGAIPAFVQRPTDTEDIVVEIDEDEQDEDVGSEDEAVVGGVPATIDSEFDEAAVEETIKIIGVTASRKGLGSKKKQPDAAIKLFINAHRLRGRKRCRRFHINVYYGNDTLAPSTDCCERCRAMEAPICCDLDNLEEVDGLITPRNDKPPTSTRAASKIKLNNDTPLSPAAKRLQAALLGWREKTAVSLWGHNSRFPPDMILHINVLNHIVRLADKHPQAVSSTGGLYEQTTWSFTDVYGEEIIILVKEHCPCRAALPASPFVSTPLRPTSHTSTEQAPATPLQPLMPIQRNMDIGVRLPPPVRKVRAPDTCSACGGVGHRLTSRSCPLRSAAQSRQGDENVPPNN